MINKALIPALSHQKKMAKLKRKTMNKRCSVCKGLMEVNGYSGIPDICMNCA